MSFKEFLKEASSIKQIEKEITDEEKLLKARKLESSKRLIMLKDELAKAVQREKELEQ